MYDDNLSLLMPLYLAIIIKKHKTIILYIFFALPKYDLRRNTINYIVYFICVNVNPFALALHPDPMLLGCLVGRSFAWRYEQHNDCGLLKYVNLHPHTRTPRRIPPALLLTIPCLLLRHKVVIRQTCKQQSRKIRSADTQPTVREIISLNTFNYLRYKCNNKTQEHCYD